MQQVKHSLAVIIISDSKNNSLLATTQTAINTALDSGVETKIIVVEKQDIKHENTITIKQNEPFNYNKCLNDGAELVGDVDYICFANNDVIFSKDWGKKIIERMKHHKVRSASPHCPIAHHGGYRMGKDSEVIGWKTRKHFAGWCFVWEKKLYEEIKLPEDYEFYCADNATIKLLEKKEIKHLLTCMVSVTHLGSRTLRTVDFRKTERYTNGCINKWNTNNSEKINFIYK